MLEVVSIGSGSCGNALLLRTASTTMLVDCGVGVRRLASVLRSQDGDLATIDALLLSHEHSDHVRELPRFVALGTPTVCTRGTAAATRLPGAQWEECASGRSLRIGDTEVHALPVSHDAAEPCGFLIRTPDGAVTVATDLGVRSGALAEAIAESRLVVLEANHDEAMVRGGPYPRHLQQRILSDTGHLSNRDCGDLLAAALRSRPVHPTVWLAHLSASNNRPALAVQTVSKKLRSAGLTLDVTALPRRDASAAWRPELARPGVSQLAFEFLP